MQSGANTTYVLYRLVRASSPVELSIKVLADYGDEHCVTVGPHPAYGGHAGRARIAGRGLRWRDAVLCAERLGRRRRPPGTGTAISISPPSGRAGFPTAPTTFSRGNFGRRLRRETRSPSSRARRPTPSLIGEAAFAKRQSEAGALLDRFFAANPGTTTASRQSSPPAVQQLVLAADQFIAARPLDGAADAKTILAGYPWFSDWGRDTMIALPGLCLATGRPWLARNILRTFSRFVSEGMLPNQFPRAGEAPAYNTVDAALWYFEAVRQYFEATSDIGLLHELFPVLERHHRRARARHALQHSRRSGGRIALCRRTGRATDLDGCEGRRPRGDSAHWKTR